MSSRWLSASLRSLVSYIGKGIIPKYVESEQCGSMVVLGQRCVRNQTVDYGQARLHDGAAKHVKNEKLVQQGDILINATGVGSAGRVAQVVEQPGQLCTTDGHVITLRASEGIDPYYLGYFLKSKQALIEQMAEGSTGQTEMNRNRLQDEIIVTYPEDPSFQRAIASIGLNLDSRVAINSRLNDYLAEYLKSCAKRLYREYERDEGADLPEGWHWTTIGEISEMVCRGITPKYNDESDELILGQTCIRNNLVLLENGRLHAPRKITEKWLKKYDLLINSTGVGSLGRTAQVWFNPSKLVVDSHVTIVRAADPRHALYMGFWAFEHERYIESLHTGSTGQTELPRNHVKAIRLVLPSDAELEKFNAVAQPTVDLIVANQKESKRLAELRDTLLPKLMSGEIDVSSVAI